MMAERPQYSGHSADMMNPSYEMGYDTPKQEKDCGSSAADSTYVKHFEEDAKIVGTKSMRSDTEPFAQTTGTHSVPSDDKPDNSTGLIGMVNNFVGRMLPVVTTPVRQENERSAHQQSSPPNRQEQGPAPKHYEQNPPTQPRKQAETQHPQIHGEDPRVQEQMKRQANQLRAAESHAQNLEVIVRTLRKDLNKANTKIAALKEVVTENEAIITQSHVTAVSALAGSVSRVITDDMIREDLKKFFQHDFFSWCADLCTDRIMDESAALKKLREIGIVNSSEDYLNSPLHLQFTVNSPDGSSPLVLLQAALARKLCCLYLIDAYFLAEKLMAKSKGRSSLRQFEQHFMQAQPDAAIDWRIQTVECLENSVPITEECIQREVQEFVKEYEFLLSEEKYDNEAEKDLVHIFTNFATLALKLWKTRVTKIEWCDIGNFKEARFEVGHPWLEVAQSLALTMGESLNGRPIGLIIRPLIASTPLSKSGQGEQVIWLKALAWISVEKEPMDQEK